MNTDDFSSPDPAAIPFPKRILEALERLQAQTTYTTLSSLSIYDLLEQRTLHTSRSVVVMLGYSLEHLHNLEPLGLASLIHPGDVNQVTDYFQRLTTLQATEVIRVEYRMRRADGSWCWLRSQETPLITANAGFPLQLLGLLQDLTEMAQVPLRTDPMLSKLVV